ncbi:styrene monooxygenase/indole monooxygenase family protein, partial [Actinosynnema sp. NPDC023658]|uniref:styrene monooxygenase/indole monooxygenase family protein n=1 Tax=Actinosynnema sp. NPDC023658 TaxID=3155465 RepID=UPI0033E018AA
VDFRLYLSRLLEDYQQRGGRVVPRTITEAAELTELARSHDLLVVAAGRSALTDAFPRDASRSPYRSPKRHLLGALFHGVRPPEPIGMTMHMVPGAGEIHAPGYYSFDGQVTAVLIEAVPDGPFAPVTDRDYADDPDAVTKAVLDLITAHAPGLRERVDDREFRLTRPIDVLRGALTPVVRHGWAEVGGGRFALAIGDAWIVNDPLTAQGANLGSNQAFELADALSVHQGPYDERFCRDISAQLWVAAQPVVDWTNTFIGEPPPQMLTLLGAAAADQRVADAFVANLDRPAEMWNSVRSPRGTEMFIAKALAVRSGV